MAVTLKTIAERCGLSIATVSQILNNRACDYSSASTKALVRDTALKLGYRRNHGYRLMHGQRTRTVVILTSMIHASSEENIRELILLILDALERNGYTCMLGNIGADESANLDKIREYLVRGAEHFIILHTPAGFRAIESAITEAGRMAISTGRCFSRHVHIRSQQASLQLIHHLQSRCGDNIRFLLASNHVNLANSRFNDFLSAFPDLPMEAFCQQFLRTYGEFHFTRDRFVEDSFAAGYAWAEELFRREPQVKGLVFSNDNFAMGAARYAVSTGRLPGRDVLLAGYNNDTAVQQYPFPISSASHDWNERVQLLINHALKPGPCQIILDARAIIRE